MPPAAIFDHLGHIGVEGTLQFVECLRLVAKADVVGIDELLSLCRWEVVCVQVEQGWSEYRALLKPVSLSLPHTCTMIMN